VKSRDDKQQRIATTMTTKCSRSYFYKPRFAIFLILPTYDFNSNDMRSTVILITCLQSQSMVLKHPVPQKRPQINARLYTAYWSRGMAECDG